mmetsp:Transcript_38101/g.89254  ORF Transcript_38101/g.89254 Transcript_38101/m.89254 type:complete len:2003 (+) Transcript_38101:126-6134(+)
MAWWQQQQAQQQQQRWGASASVAQPRPSNSPAGPAASSSAPARPPSVAAAASQAPGVTVTCRNPKPDDAAVVRTLTGDYVEHGTNHGCKVYRKPAGKGADAVDVFLYYWDASDGPSFQGWWFGNQVGGTQVWSHCASDTSSPPRNGWKVPWDGNICNEMSLLIRSPPTGRPKPPEAGPGAGQPPLPGASSAASQESVEKVVDTLSTTLDNVKHAQEQAKVLAGTFDNASALKEAEETLNPSVADITEALKKYTEVRPRAAGEPGKKLQVLNGQLRTLLQSVNMDLGKVRSARKTLEQNLRDQEAEQKDLLSFEELIPEARLRAEAAEDSVEKAVITAELIGAAGDDLEEVKTAVDQTEEAVQEAQKIIGEARIALNAKLASARKFESSSVKTKATEEISKLQKQLQDCQTKLNPLKRVRQDYQQRAAAQKLVLEVLEKLGPAEVDVDRAEEASALIAGDATKESLQEAEKAVNTAVEHISAALRFIETKKKTASGGGRDELQKLEERARESQKRLQEMKAAHKERLEKSQREAMLSEATDKVQAVSAALTQAGEAESPFLLGVEELPADQMITAVKACETALTTTSTTISGAKMFLATKLVEAKRLSKAASEGLQERLKELQEQLEEYQKKFVEIKNATAERKKEALMRESEDEVKKAEELAKTAKEKVSVLEDNEKLFEMSAAEIRKVAEEVLRAETAASQALTKTKKFVTDRQIQAKSKDPSSALSGELIKYQLRITTAITEMAKCKKLCTGIDKRLEARKVVEEAKSRLAQANNRMTSIEETLAKLKHKSGEEGEEAEGGLEAKENGEGSQEAAADKTDSESVEKMIKEIEVAVAEATATLKNAKSYVDTHSRTSNMEKEDLAKLVQPGLQQAQERLEGLTSVMKDQLEKAKVSAIVQEAKAKVEAAEALRDGVEKAEALLLESANMTAEEAGKALRDLEAKVADANQSATTTKTALAMKKLQTKRLQGPAKDKANDVLSALQDRIEAAVKTILKAKRSASEQKAGTVRREIAAIVEEVDKRVSAADEETAKIMEEGAADSSKMQSQCIGVGSKAVDAQKKLDDAKQTLLDRQKNAKSEVSADMNTTLLAEVSVALDKLKKLGEKLAKIRETIAHAEHRFVAQKLLHEAVERVEQLEQEMETVTKDAANFEEKIDIFIAVDQMAEALRKHMTNETLDVAALIGKIAGDDSKKTVSADQFVAYCTELLKKDYMTDYFLTDEQFRTSFSHMLKEGESELTEATFAEHLHARYMVNKTVSMTTTLTVAGGKTVRKLEAGEVVLALAEPKKEEAVGLVRVLARDKDNREGYISISGNQGTQYLQACSSCDAYMADSEVAFNKLASSVKEVLSYVEIKGAEIKNVRQGPLVQARADLLKLRPRVIKISHQQTDLKKKASMAQQKMSKALDTAKEKRQQAADQRAADEIAREIGAATKQLEADMTESSSAAESAVASTEDDASTKLKQAKELVEACLATAKDTAKLLAEKMELTRSSYKGPLSELKVKLGQGKVAAEKSEAKCKKFLQSIETATEELAKKAKVRLIATLQTHARSQGLGTDAFFEKLAGGAHEIAVTKLREYLSKECAGQLPDVCIDLGLQQAGNSLSRLAIARYLEDYQKCVKEIAITTTLSVKEVKTSRKLGVQEVIEVLEPAVTEDSSKLLRVKCRALSDGIVGYVTTQGNQGTPFLVATQKPYLVCEEELPLQGGFDGGSEQLRQTLRGEVFELLEGPRQEPSKEVTRLRGKCKKDGAVGYFTVKDAAGETLLEPAKRLVCKQAVALTTVFDIAEGKAIRKLDAGEVLEQLESDSKDEARGLWRTKVRSVNDSLEGWATIKGNQGTEYLKVSESFYTCVRPMSLESKLAGTGVVVRSVEAGELVEALDKPTQQTLQGTTRAKGRSTHDGLVAWMTQPPGRGGVYPWHAAYECVSATVLSSTLEVSDTATVRKIEQGETVQALSTPILDKPSGLLRARVRADKDAAVGYVSIAGTQGTLIFRASKKEKDGRR